MVAGAKAIVPRSLDVQFEKVSRSWSATTMELLAVIRLSCETKRPRANARRSMKRTGDCGVRVQNVGHPQFCHPIPASFCIVLGGVPDRFCSGACPRNKPSRQMLGNSASALPGNIRPPLTDPSPSIAFAVSGTGELMRQTRVLPGYSYRPLAVDPRHGTMQISLNSLP